MTQNIFLTFDDGPNEPHTSHILSILEKFGAKATFFVCGENVKKYPETVKKIVSNGHAIGIHTYFHNMRTVLKGGEKLRKEVEQTSDLIFNLTGIRTHLYRSPKGITVPWIKPWLSQKGYHTYHWNIMAFDWWQPSAQFIAAHIIKRARNKTIVLLHDGDELCAGDRTQTITALPVILENLSTRKFMCIPLTGEYYPQNIVRDYIIDLLQGLCYFMFPHYFLKQFAGQKEYYLIVLKNN